MRDRQTGIEKERQRHKENKRKRERYNKIKREKIALGLLTVQLPVSSTFDRKMSQTINIIHYRCHYCLEEILQMKYTKYIIAIYAFVNPLL